MLMRWLFTMLCASFPVFASFRCASSGCFRQRRVCEDPFVYVCLSSSWTRSSSLRDFRQDDRHLVSHYYHCYASCFVLSLCRITYHLLIMPPILLNQASNPPCPSKLLFGYVTALLSPSHSVVSCRWRLKFVPCWNMEMLFLVGTCLLVGISQYLLFN